jgi:hypothetical protein
MGRYKGDWYCGVCDDWNYANREKCRTCSREIDEAEYVMGDEDYLKDPLPKGLISRRKMLTSGLMGSSSTQCQRRLERNEEGRMREGFTPGIDMDARRSA